MSSCHLAGPYIYGIICEYHVLVVYWGLDWWFNLEWRWWWWWWWWWWWVWCCYTLPHSERDVSLGGMVIVSLSCCSACPALFLIQTSSALQSLSSPSSSHKSPSSPSPCHLTRYCILWPLCRSSTILSTKNSCVPSMIMGFGGWRACEGKRVLLFSWKGFTLDVWKMGIWLESFGNASITVECCSLVAIMLYRPSNWGMNLATCSSSPDLYNCRWLVVNSTTWSPTLKGNDSCRCEFSWCACCTFAVRRLSWASIWRGCICVMSSQAEGSGWSSSGGSIEGSIHTGLLKCSWNGVNPVDAFIVFLSTSLSPHPCPLLFLSHTLKFPNATIDSPVYLPTLVSDTHVIPVLPHQCLACSWNLSWQPLDTLDLVLFTSWPLPFLSCWPHVSLKESNASLCHPLRICLMSLHHQIFPHQSHPPKLNQMLPLLKPSTLQIHLTITSSSQNDQQECPIPKSPPFSIPSYPALPWWLEGRSPQKSCKNSKVTVLTTS